MSKAVWQRGFRIFVAVALLVGAGMSMADPQREAGSAHSSDEAAERQRHALVEAMLAEPLATTSPDGLRMADRLLAKSFNRGIDDLDGYVYLLKLVTQHALALAERHPDQAVEYRQAALAMTYNLATNTWIGWGTDAVGAIASSHRQLGLQAARKNIELAAQLNLGPKRRRNGYWVLGAHLLADGDHAEAVAAFATSRDLSAEAEMADGALMAQGWMYLAHLLAGEDEELQRAQLERLQEELRERGEDGAFYADQYAVALAALRADDENRSP